MCAEFLACLEFYDVAFLLAHVLADVVVVVDFSKETDALRVVSLCAWKSVFLRKFSYLTLRYRSDRKHRFFQLRICYPRKKICLVFECIYCRSEPRNSIIINPLLGIMACGDAVELIACLLLESSEFYETVAHHVGVRCQAFAHRLHSVCRHTVVILFLQVDDVEFAAVFLRDVSGDFNVFLRRAVHEVFLAFKADLDVKNMRVDALLLEEWHYHGTVDAARD